MRALAGLVVMLVVWRLMTHLVATSITPCYGGWLFQVETTEKIGGWHSFLASDLQLVYLDNAIGACSVKMAVYCPYFARFATLHWYVGDGSFKYFCGVCGIGGIGDFSPSGWVGR